jgi:hypothetical protein
MELSKLDIENINRLVAALGRTSMPKIVLNALEVVLHRMPEEIGFNQGGIWDPGEEAEMGCELFIWHEFCRIYNRLATGETISGIRLDYENLQDLQAIDNNNMNYWIAEITPVEA